MTRSGHKADASEGMIFDIQRFSIHDGPGIRTTVFFKGCNLRCEWCHNPESISPKPVIEFYAHKCIRCMQCTTVCPNHCLIADQDVPIYNRASCTGCGKCTVVCYAQARQLAGKKMTVDEILDIVKLDKPFYAESGGLTCSGGEPMLQHDFLLRLMQKAKLLHLHTAVDTAGNVPFTWFEQIRPYVVLFLYDLKIMDDIKHMKYTGVSNKRIIRNLIQLADGRNNIYIRIPIIPEVNDHEENMESAANLISQLSGISKIELLPFHPLGAAKYASLDQEYAASGYPKLDRQHLERMAECFRRHQLNVFVSP